jgi:hypothetical protein
MAFLMDDVASGGQFMVGEGQPVAIGIGPSKIRGSAYIEGPNYNGNANEYGDVKATVMLAPLRNSDTISPLYSLWVRFYARIQSYLRVDILIKTEFLRVFKIRATKIHAIDIKTVILRARYKNFQIPHPLKEDKDLVHSCLEGPEIGVYCRGRVKNKTIIDLPDYWTGLVHEDSITVQLQPVGAHQDVIIKRIGDNQIHLQSKGGMPIDCFYHVYGERKDVDKLEIEVNREDG